MKELSCTQRKKFVEFIGKCEKCYDNAEGELEKAKIAGVLQGIKESLAIIILDGENP